MKIKTLNEWLNESNQGFLEPTEENLRKYGLDPNKVTVNSDGSIDYDGDVKLWNMNLHSIPFNFNKINGYFNCSYNQLVSLAGAPAIVKGDFYCHHNRLVNLAGSPGVVEGDFYCNDNLLVSLAGCPKAVNRDFYCSSNRLVSLEGCPEKVDRNFRCYYNQLVSLKGCPEEIGGSFYCEANQLISLAGAPKVTNGEFIRHSNLILYNPTEREGSFDINKEWSIKDPSGKWIEHVGSDYLRMAFGRLDELTMEEVLGIEEGLKKVEIPNDLRAYCENKLYQFQVKYNPKTKTQKFFHDAEMDDDLLGMI